MTLSVCVCVSARCFFVRGYNVSIFLGTMIATGGVPACYWPAALMERGRTRSPTPATHCAQDTGQDCDLHYVCLWMCLCEVGVHREHLSRVFTQGHN